MEFLSVKMCDIMKNCDFLRIAFEVTYISAKC